MENNNPLLILALSALIASCPAFPANNVDAFPAASPTTFTDKTIGMEFVFVKGGCFDMGDSFNEGGFDEKPVHRICLGDFYIGKYETTQNHLNRNTKEASWRTTGNIQEAQSS